MNANLKAEITTALSKVIDPELRRPITELGMVESIDIDNKKITLKILLTISGCPLKDKIRTDVESA